MARAATPDDLYRFRIPTDPNLSPDGRLVAFTVQTPSPKRDGYRHAIWVVPTDGSVPARQMTIGQKHDLHPRFAPDGRTLAFLSDRRMAVEEPLEGVKEGDREDQVQVHLLPIDGGEARRLTDLPRGVDDFVWAPDGNRLVVATTSRAATMRGRCPSPPAGPATTRRATPVGLPVPRPPQLLVQRSRLHRRPG